MREFNKQPSKVGGYDGGMERPEWYLCEQRRALPQVRLFYPTPLFISSLLASLPPPPFSLPVMVQMNLALSVWFGRLWRCRMRCMVDGMNGWRR